MARTRKSSADKPRYKDALQSVQVRTEDLLARMTLEEKVYQLAAAAVVGWVTQPPELVMMPGGKFSEPAAKKLIAKGIGFFSELVRYMPPRQGAEVVNRLQKHAMEQTRLGIPLLVIDEALHGCSAETCTAFPQAIGMACCWDEPLMRQAGDVARREAMSRGIRQVLAPDLDVSRDPRWGRTEETFGEDPHLVSRLGAAYIKGIQGDMLTADSVGCTLKHYAVHGSPEGGLNIGPTAAGERMAREVYLKPFEVAVREAHVMSVMSAYCEIDGVPASGSRKYMTDILRGEWGFDGFVVSDYGSIAMMTNRHRTAVDKADAGAQAITAGVDVELPTLDCFREFIEMVRQGKFPGEVLDESVRRVLRAKFRLGLFENPYVNPAEAVKEGNSPANRQVALELARKSIVLLKNDGLLPVAASAKSIAVIGPNADAGRIGNYGTSKVHVVTPLEGLKNHARKGVQVRHAKGCEIYGSDKSGFAEAVKLAGESDMVVAVLGEVSDWGSENPNPVCGEGYDQDSLDLAGVQLDLLKALCQANRNVAVVLYNGRPLSVRWIKDNARALVEAWYPGCEGGNALAEILLGKVNPSGRLAITIPATVGQLPVFYNHKSAARGFNHKPGTSEVTGKDYVFSSPEPLFTFGDGLSYTKFEYRGLKVTPRIHPHGRAVVSVEVRNAGKLAGEEVVQLYIRDEFASVTRPILELRGFTRVFLKPGQSQRVEMVLTDKDLGVWNRQMQFAVEPGWFEVMVGPNTRDVLTARFEVVGEGQAIPAGPSGQEKHSVDDLGWH